MPKAIDFVFTKDECRFLFEDGTEKVVNKDGADYQQYFSEVENKDKVLDEPVSQSVEEPVTPVDVSFVPELDAVQPTDTIAPVEPVVPNQTEDVNAPAKELSVGSEVTEPELALAE